VVRLWISLKPSFQLASTDRTPAGDREVEVQVQRTADTQGWDHSSLLTPMACTGTMSRDMLPPRVCGALYNLMKAGDSQPSLC
jgi:hypothetical protein